MITVWFVVIAFLWTGYFVLEGFDFGVGALLPFVTRTPAERAQAVATIGPVWDGNEVWLVTAVGSMFAAFPAWYSGFLSAFYLPMLLIVVALIIRGVGLEWRGKVHGPREVALCDAGLVGGSALAAFLWGAVFGGLLLGSARAAVLGGILSLGMAVLHGAVFLALKTTGPVRARARTAALLTSVAAIPVAAVALPSLPGASAPAAPGWAASPWLWAAAVAAMATLASAAALTWRRREAWAFAATAATIALTTATVFGALHPAPLPGLAPGLTVASAASAPYTLTMLTWIAALALPGVLAYQSWTYWIFRKRVILRHPQ
ncbi:cytochrome d ubiquinol oxidase subunit II [Streptosporangiaceae bacterium NEAU-GS5]|nr:cytochrome d ubiquinol oxidase subunit II [Streptosporangiaceae bacterium NEAU-GS5]